MRVPFSRASTSAAPAEGDEEMRTVVKWPGDPHGTTEVHSNATVTTVTIPSPMEKFIGTEKYEAIAKRDFETHVIHESKLKDIKAMIEVEHPKSARLYSAVRIVYEMRSDAFAKLHDVFALEEQIKNSIGEIDRDETLSAADKSTQLQAQIDRANLERKLLDTDARAFVERCRRQLDSLLGGVSTPLFERFYSFQPQFAAQPLQPD